jgi:hypothetical protein
MRASLSSTEGPHRIRGRKSRGGTNEGMWSTDLSIVAFAEERHTSCSRCGIQAAFHTVEYGEVLQSRLGLNVKRMLMSYCDRGLEPGRALGLTHIPATTATKSFRCLMTESYLFVEGTPDKV